VVIHNVQHYEFCLSSSENKLVVKILRVCILHVWIKGLEKEQRKFILWIIFRCIFWVVFVWLNDGYEGIGLGVGIWFILKRNKNSPYVPMNKQVEKRGSILELGWQVYQTWVLKRCSPILHQIIYEDYVYAVNP
jgi:hypothetical protein